MQNLSANQKQHLYEGGDVKVTISGETLDGVSVTITEDDIVEGTFSIERSWVSGSGLEIGCADTSELVFTLDNEDGRWSGYRWEGTRLTVVLDIDDEPMQAGTFTIDEPPQKLTTMQIRALDNMARFNRPYVPGIAYPATLRQILLDACSRCGVALFTQSFDNDIYVVSQRPEGDDITFHHIVSWVAELAGCNAWIDQMGRLHLSWYGENQPADGTAFFFITPNMIVEDEDPALIVGPDDRFSYELAEADIEITGIVYCTEDTDYLAGNDKYALVIEENLLLQDNYESLLNSLLSKLGGFKYRPYKFETIGYPHLWPGDKITRLIDAEGNITTSIITNHTYKLNGNSSVEAKGETETVKGYATGAPFTPSQKRVLQAVAKVEAARQTSSMEQAVLQLNELMVNSLGFYTTTVELETGAKITYTHDKPTLDESQIIWTQTELGFAWTDQGWQGGSPVWNYGITADGNIIVKLLTVIGVNAEWMNTGTLTVGGEGNEVIISVLGPTGEEEIGHWDNTGFKIEYGSIGGNDVADLETKEGAQGKADTARTAAEAVAVAQAALAQTNAEAHADGVVSAEEQARIDQATTNLATAKTYAEQKAQEAEEAANLYTSQQLANYVDVALYEQDIEALQAQVDGSITTWFYDGVPTLNNAPANEWTTTDLKNQHLGDLYYDNATGYAYRFRLDESTYSWLRITDSDVTKALQDAATAKDVADSKRRVFVSTPTPPYDIGDLWTQGSNGDLYKCKVARSTGSYVAGDWEKAVKYTDDTVAIAAQSAAETANELLADIASDAKLTPEEKQATKKEWDAIAIEHPTMITQAEEAGITAEKSNYNTAYNNLNDYLNVGSPSLLRDLTTTSSIVGTTFRSKFADYYNKKAALLKAITDTKVYKKKVIFEINNSTETATIQASKINLVGAVTVLSSIAGNLGTITAGELKLGGTPSYPNTHLQSDGTLKAGMGGSTQYYFKVPYNADGIYNCFRPDFSDYAAARWKRDDTNYIYHDPYDFFIKMRNGTTCFRIDAHTSSTWIYRLGNTSNEHVKIVTAGGGLTLEGSPINFHMDANVDGMFSVAGRIITGSYISAGGYIRAIGGVLSDGNVEAGNNMYIAGEYLVFNDKAILKGLPAPRLQVRNVNDNGYLPISASSFDVGSSREYKKNIVLAEDTALAAVTSTPVYSFQLKDENGEGEGRYRIGVVVEEAPEEVKSDDCVSLSDSVGLLWKAIQELSMKVDALGKGGGE